MRSTPLLFVLLGIACNGGPKVTAMEACKRLESRHAVSSCQQAERGGLASWARDKANFTLPSGKTGQILTFDGAENFDKTVAAFSAAAVLAGPHRYANRRSLIFAQLNQAADPGEAEAIKQATEEM
jgi:hypothetical protein